MRVLSASVVSGHKPSGVRRRHEAMVAYAFLSLNLIGFLTFTLGPVLASLGLSLARWDLLTPPEFVGLANYAELLFEDPLFWLSLRNTLLYSAMAIPTAIAVALALALLVNQPIRGARVYRTLYFVPVVCSMVSVALVWKWVFNKEFGILNYALAIVGIGQVDWLGEPAIALPAVVLLSVWKGMGYNMVIFLAGLQGIPEHLYDAAKVDGAGRWQAFRHVTLPLLSPTTFFIAVLAVIGSFQVFDQVYLMTQGGPGNATLVYNFYLYQNAFLYLKMGLASAMAYVLFGLVFVVTLLQVRYLGRQVNYELG